MAINRVEIKDFLVFKGEFAVDFCSGVNVIIGGNATGKTTLLKYMYWHMLHHKYLDWETNSESRERFIGIEHYFNNIDIDYARNLPVKKYCLDGEYKEPVFIPVAEMLSHSKGLLALVSDRKISFDRTQIDILAKAELGETNELKPNAIKLLDKINKMIGGKVVYENDIFYTVSESDDNKIPFSLEASGFKKLGLLWKLLRNGLLESGSVLFWDEPEASINPELMPVLVDILLELQRGGVQMFIATHSYNLARYFDVNKREKDKVMFYNLSKNDNSGIKCVSAPDYTKLPESVLDKADEKLFKAVVANAMEIQSNE